MLVLRVMTRHVQIRHFRQKCRIKPNLIFSDSAFLPKMPNLDMPGNGFSDSVSDDYFVSEYIQKYRQVIILYTY